MEVKPGYKWTQVGIIPEDWSLDYIENLCHISTGKKNTEDRVDDGLYPFFVRSKIVEHINTYSYDGEAVLTAGDGVGTGKVFHYIKGKFDVHQRVYCISGFSKYINGYFFFLYFSSYFYYRIMQMTAKSSVDSVRREMIAKMPIPFPSYSEQKAIMEALRDADALIESLEQLIAKKRQIKQAAMQELLTGKRRLPGFCEKWEIKRLDAVSDIDPDNLGSATLPDYAFNYISLEDVDVGFLRGYSEQIFRFAPSRARRLLKRNDILVSTVRPNLQSHLLFTFTQGSWVCSTGFSVVRCKSQQADPGYIFYHFFDYHITKQIEALLTGSNYPAINGKDIKALQVPIPTLLEQSAIATILSDIDAEITALETKLEKLRKIKQGMMYNLLTGRIRLI